MQLTQRPKHFGGCVSCVEYFACVVLRSCWMKITLYPALYLDCGRPCAQGCLRALRGSLASAGKCLASRWSTHSLLSHAVRDSVLQHGDWPRESTRKPSTRTAAKLLQLRGAASAAESADIRTLD